MKLKKNIFLLILILFIYFLNESYLKTTGFWFFTDYLNDLMAVPLFFSIVNIVSQIENGREINDLSDLAIITIILSFLGEFVAIYTRPGSIVDIFDICCYFIGMIFYYIYIKFPKKSNIKIE